MARLLTNFNLLRLLRRLFTWALLVIFVGFLGLNILLNSPLAKGRIEKLLSEKTGDVWEVGALNLSLNGKVIAHEIYSEIEGGEIQIDCVTVDPNYSRLVRGELGLHSITVSNPSCIVTELWLLNKMRTHKLKTEFTTEPEPPTVAKNETTPQAPNNQTSSPTDPGSVTSGKKPETPAAPEVASGQISVTTKEGTKPSHSKIFEDIYEEWVYIENGEFVLKMNDGEILELKNVSAELPVGGEDLVGSVRWDNIQLLNKKVVPKGSFNISKKGVLISVKETEVDFFGMHLEPDIYLVKGGSSLMFYLDLKIPQQTVSELFTHLNLTMNLSMESIAGRMQFAGDLLKPMTWKSAADVRALGVQTEEGHRGTTAYFDTFILQCTLDKGILRLPQLSMHGEDVSVMSNGLLAMNGYGFGILRVVASEEMADWIDRVHQGSHLVDGVRWHIMKPMGNEDRYSMDIHIDGMITDPMMKVKNVSEWQPIFPALKRLKTFIKNERDEDLELRIKT